MVKRGVVVRGMMLAYDVPAKVVCDKADVHESTLSRFTNGLKDVNDDQFAKICVAVGEAKTEVALTGRTHG